MTFLNPAVLFGLLAAGIPVLIHLLNLRKLKRIEISTLVFLQEMQKNKIKKIKLKQLLLLLLRVLIVLALVTAFARPTLQSVTFGSASAAKTTAVFIIDDSYSMNVVDVSGSKFNLARQYVKKHLANLQEGDDAVVLFTSRAGTETPALTGNLKSLLSSVDEARISDVSRTLHESVLIAAQLIGASDNFNKELYILSDLQQSRLIADSLFTDMSALLTERVQVYLFPLSGKQPYNLGIDSMHVNSAILQRDKQLRTTVYLHNYTNATVKNSVASLFINGERVSQKGYSAESGATVPVQLEAVIKNTGYLEIVAAIEDDDILTDNKVYAAVKVPDKISIGIFEMQTGDSRFIQAALNADDSLTSIKTEIKPLGMLPSTGLEKYDLLYIVGADDKISFERLSRFVNAGGGAFLCPGTNSTATEYNVINSALGIPAATGMQGLKDSPLPLNFAKIDDEHPLFNGIFKDRKKKTIDSPELNRLILFPANGAGRKLITLNSNEPVLTEYRVGKGKVLLLGIAPVPAWGTLPFKGIFIPLVYRAVYFLSANESETTPRFAGDELSFDVSRQPGKVLKLIKTGGLNETISGGEQINGTLSYNKSDVTGNYKLQVDGKTTGVYPVNHNPVESDMKILQPADFKAYLERLHVASAMHIIKDPERSVQEVKEARYGSELWKWFLILAFILAVTESLIARDAKKDLSSI